MILVGICGWSRLYQAIPLSRRRGKTTLRAYAELFQAAEVNSSFYRFHRAETYRKWRADVPQGFEFTIKCHRSISHEARLRATKEALRNMGRMVEAAEACESRVLVLQTPASLRAGEETLGEVGRFLEGVEKGETDLAWETRGNSWKKKEAKQMLKEFLERYGVVHVTDPFKIEPVAFGDFAYFRLHGLPGYNLRYTYTNNQLLHLNKLLKRYERKTGRVYVFFNNYNMYRDAERFLALRRNGEPPPSPFGPRSLWWTLRTIEDWPITKEQLLSRCGLWRCWVEPNMGVTLEAILQKFRDKTYSGLEDVVEEARRFWEETGYPTSEEVERGSSPP